jgi:hypothetical protein
LRAPLGELEALAAAAVVEPHLAGAGRALRGEVLARHDVLAVGRPVGAVEEAEGLFADLLRVLAVAVGDPDVVAAPLVAGEGELLAVGAVARLLLPGDVVGQGARLAAADRQRVEVAQEVEDDLLAVGGDIEAHPGPRGDVDRHLLFGARRVVDVPLLLFLFGLLARLLLARDRLLLDRLERLLPLDRRALARLRRPLALLDRRLLLLLGRLLLLRQRREGEEQQEGDEEGVESTHWDSLGARRRVRRGARARGAYPLRAPGRRRR